MTTNYPWDGNIKLELANVPRHYRLNLRIPAWAENWTVQVNGKPVAVSANNGWARIKQNWSGRDMVALNLQMSVVRTKAPARFRDYDGLIAIERGPLVYSIEEADVGPNVGSLVLPDDAPIVPEFRSEFLGGVTVLRTNLLRPSGVGQAPQRVDAMMIPYGVWNNRTPGEMRIWLPTKVADINDLIKQMPATPPGETASHLQSL
jgi:hypothetical protein